MLEALGNVFSTTARESTTIFLCREFLVFRFVCKLQPGGYNFFCQGVSCLSFRISFPLSFAKYWVLEAIGEI